MNLLVNRSIYLLYGIKLKEKRKGVVGMKL